jgi:hypothetical protein
LKIRRSDARSIERLGEQPARGAAGERERHRQLGALGVDTNHRPGMQQVEGRRDRSISEDGRRKRHDVER